MEWFSEWFNSPYYHLLYNNRDFKEAELFIDELIKKLEFSSQQKFLDLACGKGRHSIYLNSKGFNVTGLDIAPESIASANKSSNETLKFAVHDMRNALEKYGKFDYILNLFTSFGYFEDDNENLKTILEIEKGLNTDGHLVLDFMNTSKIISNLVESETKTIESVTFHIKRKVENGFIIKNINFSDKGVDYSFEERVNALNLEHFKNYFKIAKLEIKAIYGNYSLEEFNQINSPRMIFVVKKCQ